MTDKTQEWAAGTALDRRALLKMTGAGIAVAGVASLINTSTAKAQTMTE